MNPTNKVKTHHRRRTPQNKFKELRKDIESFQTEVKNLLENVPPSERDNLCVVCKQNEDCHELPCNHVICQSCFDTQMKKKHFIHCLICNQTHFHLMSRFDSSSSSDNEL